MAQTNHDRVGKVLELLCAGLKPFVERELRNNYKQEWFAETKRTLTDNQIDLLGTEAEPQWDAAGVLVTMWNQWNDVFRKVLGHAERSLVSELRETRNRWAHHRTFSTDDTYRALDSSVRLLAAVSAPEADEVEKMKMDLLRVRFDEQARTEKRKTSGTLIEGQASGGLKPWREVVNPHKDVASGRYQQAEFAADLWQVHLGEGSDEYRKPTEFFRRTFLTESLKQLLTDAIRRLGKGDGDPVVQLQTNFGGGKTHSMLALYHLFSGARANEMPGIEAIQQAADVDKLPTAKRVVLVGNKISPGNPSTKPDGTVVRTLWGELAWQLGGKKAFNRIKLDDERATNPGDALRELFNEFGPCLILIDEWVAYARQLHEQNDLPAGSFETHFSFTQALTESAKLAKNCLLVISLPASDTTGSPHAQGEDVEVGGERGRAALDRLRNAIGRVEASWRPATAEEGFEIVRRRLFEPLVNQADYVSQDLTAKTFAEMYQKQHHEFPPECRDIEYEKRLKAAYPIHPEVFDRLYTDWSTLVKFQRTRGVLRLMAAVIHTLWEKGDRNPLILPCNIPIDDQRVQFELNRYLSDNWVPVIERDVDGANSLPVKMDSEFYSSFGKLQAFRRVARTIYLGSAPTAKAANKGLEDRRIKLGCVLPGETPSVFGDALRRLSQNATYLYHDSARYWYSTQPTVTKLAEDRAEQLKNNPDKITQEIERRLRIDCKEFGDFARIHVAPKSTSDVADDLDSRLVVLGPDQPFSKGEQSPATQAAKVFFESRGNSPRLFRNTIVFLSADTSRLTDLDEAVRRYLAWEAIVDEATELELTPYQHRQATNQKESSDSMVKSRLPEVYQWLLVPSQSDPQSTLEWQQFRLNGQEPLAVRASKKLGSNELLIKALAATRLRLEMDKIPLWRDNHVAIKQLLEDFGKYCYLPRVKDASVLISAVEKGVGSLSPQDTFAYADSFSEQEGRYLGLQMARNVAITSDDAGLLVKPEIAIKQYNAEHSRATPSLHPIDITTTTVPDPQPGITNRASNSDSARPVRFHGSVTLDASRVGRDAGRIADEVIAHLVSLIGAEVKVTLEIEAKITPGTPDNVVRTVTENCRTLKFNNHGFETE